MSGFFIDSILLISFLKKVLLFDLKFIYLWCKINKIMEIYFKNGTSVKITKEIGQILLNRIVKECYRFQMFTDKNGELLLILNLDEIVYVK